MISITTQEINSNSCTPYTSSMQVQTKLFLLSPFSSFNLPASLRASNRTQMHSTMSISSSAQYVTLQKIFLMSKFTYIVFSNSPHKSEIGIAKGGRLLIAIHLDQSNYLANRQQVLGFDVSFTSLSIFSKNAGSKLFCWAKPACFDFSSCNFLLQCHILSTTFSRSKNSKAPSHENTKCMQRNEKRNLRGHSVVKKCVHQVHNSSIHIHFFSHCSDSLFPPYTQKCTLRVSFHWGVAPSTLDIRSWCWYIFPVN